MKHSCYLRQQRGFNLYLLRVGLLSKNASLSLTEQMEAECFAQAVIMKVRKLKRGRTVSVTNHFSNLEATAAL